MINKMKTYFNSLRQRDQRAILLGAAAVTLIGAYLGIFLPLMEDWSFVRNELKSCRSRLDSVSGKTPGSQAKMAGLYQTVPFVEWPQEEEVQRKLFWNKTYDQLRNAGINISSGPSYISAAKQKTGSERATLRLKFAANCKYEQLVNYLVRLNENPYLVSIEELSVKSDEKQPDQVSMDMTVTTFVK